MAAILISPQFKPVKSRVGTTFGGSHLACAAAIAVLDVMKEERLMNNAVVIGNLLMNRFSEFPEIKEVRGRGLMIGLEFDFPVKELRETLLYKYHIFTGVAGNNIIRLLPPLSLNENQVEYFLTSLKKALKK